MRKNFLDKQGKKGKRALSVFNVKQRVIVDFPQSITRSSLVDETCWNDSSWFLANSIRTVNPEKKPDKGTFTQLEIYGIIRNPELNPVEKAVLSDIISYDWFGNGAFPSYETLAVHMRKSRSTAKRAAYELRDKGYISWTKRGYAKTNLYKVNYAFIKAKHKEIEAQHQLAQKEASNGSSTPSLTGHPRPIEVDEDNEINTAEVHATDHAITDTKDKEEAVDFNKTLEENKTVVKEPDIGNSSTTETDLATKKEEEKSAVENRIALEKNKKQLDAEIDQAIKYGVDEAEETPPRTSEVASESSHRPSRGRVCEHINNTMCYFPETWCLDCRYKKGTVIFTG